MEINLKKNYYYDDMVRNDVMKIMFVRPPCHLWPIINQSDNFLLPLNFPCLAAYLREKMEGVKIKILDCLPNKIGWKTLRKIIAEENPDVIGVGEPVVYQHEAAKVLKIAKELNPEVITIAGGHFFSAAPEWAQKNYPFLDYIVRWEGEETLREFLEVLRKGNAPDSVRSIAFRKGDKIVITPPRPLIKNLDDLPIPAYDMVPLDKYAPFGILWPRSATVQRGRGCPYNCKFCTWTVQEGEHIIVDGKETFRPAYRSKSWERMVYEVEILYEKYKRKYLFWVDATWNLDNKWLYNFCSEIIRRGYKIGFWAFLRADLLIEQEKEGILELIVKAGLRHTLIGGERPDEEELQSLSKTNYRGGEALRECCEILKKKYPQVFRQATFITGIRTETWESLERLGKYTRDIVDLDFAGYHPLTPFPGTRVWFEANEKGWIEEKNFENYDMFYPVMPSEHLSREEIAEGTSKLYRDFVMKKPLRYFLRMFSRHKIRRRLHIWFFFSIFRVLLLDLWYSILGRKKFEGFAGINKLWKPPWYDR